MVAWCQESNGSIPQSQLLQVRQRHSDRTHDIVIRSLTLSNLNINWIFNPNSKGGTQIRTMHNMVHEYTHTHTLYLQWSLHAAISKWIFLHRLAYISHDVWTKTNNCVLLIQPPLQKCPLLDAVCVSLQNFLNSSSCPEIQGYLHLKEPGRKSWKKLYMFLRRSGLYYSTKGTSKVIDGRHVDTETCTKNGGDSLPHPPL